MLSRRKLLLAAAATLLSGRAAIAATQQEKAAAGQSWSAFQQKMTALAEEQAKGNISQQLLVDQGIQSLIQLDVGSAGFREAVEAAYETGNRYWLWQRMIKQQNINGGILNISKDQLVQLHDHPGATGLLRIISGETEVWQFDQVANGKTNVDKTAEVTGMVDLVRVSRRILKPGDTAVLTPESGNIHALRAVSSECRMLDFFIPPYQRSQRSWYEPLNDDWFDKDRLACRKIPQDAYTQA